jgi:hypothetical protein
MGVAVEVLTRQELGRGVESLVVDQDRAEDGPFSLQVVRERSLGRGGLDAQAANISNRPAEGGPKKVSLPS